ncbi:hypothetical protein AOLI_G00262720 [Acnodon oligacanthus]
MNPAVEVMAFFLGFSGWVMSGISIPNKFWRVAEMEGNVITAHTIYENLWMSCMVDSTGVHNCQEFPSMLGLSGTLALRSGLPSAHDRVHRHGNVRADRHAGGNAVLQNRRRELHPEGKNRCTGGVFFILQGLCTMIAVSWYAFNITQEFFDPPLSWNEV